MGSPGNAAFASSRPSIAPLAGAMRWIGPGRTAFAGAAGEDRQGEAWIAAGEAEVLASSGSGGDRSFLAALRAYFEGGGGPCTVLNLPPPESLAADRRAALWVGEDGGPGLRSGVWSLCDDEGVGTIAAPGLRDLTVRQSLVALARAREDRFVVLDSLPDGLPDGAPEDLPGAERVAVVAGWTTDGEGNPVPPCGAVLAGFEQRDFREDRPQEALRGLLGAGDFDGSRLEKGHPALHGSRPATVEAWRAWEGLRRSIERGTRWVVFEVADEFLLRRIEREVGAFLMRLYRLGLLRGRTPEEAFHVGSRWSEGGPGGSSERRLVLDVAVNMPRRGRNAGEFDVLELLRPVEGLADHQKG